MLEVGWLSVQGCAPRAVLHPSFGRMSNVLFQTQARARPTPRPVPLSSEEARRIIRSYYMSLEQSSGENTPDASAPGASDGALGGGLGGARAAGGGASSVTLRSR